MHSDDAPDDAVSTGSGDDGVPDDEEDDEGDEDDEADEHNAARKGKVLNDKDARDGSKAVLSARSKEPVAGIIRKTVKTPGAKVNMTQCNRCLGRI